MYDIVHAPDKSSGHRTQEIEIHYRFDVTVTTAVVENTNHDKKERLRNRTGYAENIFLDVLIDIVNRLYYIYLERR